MGRQGGTVKWITGEFHILIDEERVWDRGSWTVPRSHRLVLESFLFRVVQVGKRGCVDCTKAPPPACLGPAHPQRLHTCASAAIEMWQEDRVRCSIFPSGFTTFALVENLTRNITCSFNLQFQPVVLTCTVVLFLTRWLEGHVENLTRSITWGFNL